MICTLQQTKARLKFYVIKKTLTFELKKALIERLLL